ncbi:hypothetical protein ABZX12_07950 [Kribbella sp. NPDC003505]|uniref:hypothetical protein n=1 Tax=Kribbella sp. NPDC003505 TaxID=3154448 RepID=UPI0033A49E4C
MELRVDKGAVRGGNPMDNSTIELRFARGDAGADTIQAAVDDIVAELKDPSSEASTAVQQAGVDLQEITDLKVDVKEGAQGLEPFVTPILIGITVSVGSKIAETLWKEVIWPRLRRRLGVNVLQEQQNDGPERPST